jgi:hypothetical protein
MARASPDGHASRRRYAAAVAVQRFPIRIGRRSALLLRLAFGVRPDLAWADVGDGRLVIRFGRAEFRTELANLSHWTIEGPFLWVTAIGIRMSIRHRDVSFAGSPHGGVRVDLRERVPWGPFRIPAVWVAADDLAAFAGALEAAGIPGRDARRG